MPIQMFTTEKNKSPSNIKHTIAVAAGKGGVGKSTISVNLALALILEGYSVGILDADIYGPSVRRMLPEVRPPSQKDDLIIPAICGGDIRMISMAYFKGEGEPSVVRAPIANNIIKQFLKNVAWGNLDFLIIDFPPGTGDVQLTLSQQANLRGALIVTTPQEIALIDVRKCINMFSHVKIPLVGIVENMSYFSHQESGEKISIFGKGGGEKLARECGAPLLGQIPIDPLICSCGDSGSSLFSYHAAKPSATMNSFAKLVDRFVSHVLSIEKQPSHFLGSFELVWKEF